MKFKGRAARSKKEAVVEEAGDSEVASPKKRSKNKKPKKEKAPKAPKTPKAAKVKTGKLLKQIKLPKKSEFVLTIGDEGAILVHLEGQKLKGRWFAADASEEAVEIFDRAIANDMRAPIILALDTIDQHYSQQTLPPVSKMSLSGLLKRRAQREFGRDIQLQGNYFLSRSESKEWEYMMYALEIAEHTKPWMSWVSRLPNRPKGIRVLPLEAAVMTQAIMQSQVAKHGATKETPWQYLVSYNKVSGVRQVILQDGKMVFTRLGQPLEGDPSTEAGAIEQEVISTVEYLKRIGLKDIADLSLYVVAAKEIVSVIDIERMGVKGNAMLSPHEAAEGMGLESAIQEDDRYGDILLAAFIASYKKSAHILWTKPLGSLKNLYLGIPVMRVIGALVILGCLGYSGYSGYQYWNSANALEGFVQKRDSLDQQVVSLQKQANLPKERLEKILQTYEVYKAIKHKQIAPKDFMLNLSWAVASLPSHMRIQSIVWSKPSATNNNSAPTAPKPKAGQTPPKGTPVAVEGRLNINILVPSAIHREALEIQANNVVEKLGSYFPQYEVKLGEVPGARSVSDSMEMVMELNATEEKDEQDTDELRPVTLQTIFTGFEYVPEPVFEGRL